MTHDDVAGVSSPPVRALPLALVCPLIGAALFAAFDFAAGWSVIPARLDGLEKVLLIAHGLGRHLLLGAALGLIQAVLMLAPKRIGPFDGRVLAFTALFSTLFVYANWTLADGAKVSQQSWAPLLRWGLRIGGPIAIFVALVALRRLVVVPLSRRRDAPIVGFALALLCAAGSAFLAWQNVTRWPNLYPGLHLQMAFGALLLAEAAVFAAVRHRPFVLDRRPIALGAVAIAALAVVVVSMIIPRLDRFQPVRSSVSAFFQGSVPFQPLLAPAYDAFSSRRTLRVADVQDLIARQRAAATIDVEAVLQQVPNRRSLNVLLVALDTVRWDHTTPGGHHRDTTPFLAELAEESYVFENAYTPYPTSNYAYAAMLTGLHAGATPLHLFRTYRREEWQGSPEVYYPELFSKRGLWSLGVTTFAMQERENARFFGMLENGFDAFNPDQHGRAGHLDAEVTTSLLRRLRERPSTRFFAFAQYFAPHDPYESRDGFDFGPGVVDRYDSEIAFVDRELRRLVDGLKAEGLWDDLVLVVFSDHGEALGEHGNNTHNTSLYEEEVRVPLLVRVPGLPGGGVAAPVSLIDVVPTLTKLLDVDDRVPRFGSSVLPWMFGYPDLPERVVFAQQYTPRPPLPDLERRCVVHLGHKLIETVERPESAFELYDLAHDPDETRNLFGRPEAADVQERLLGLLAAKVAESDAYIGKDEADDPVNVFRSALTTGVEKLRSEDPAIAREGARELRVALLNRYSAANEMIAFVEPDLIESVRDAARQHGTAALPGWNADVLTILSLLPAVENAPYIREMMLSDDPRVRFVATLAASRQPEPLASEVRGDLRAMIEAIPDPLRRFEGAIALAGIGEPDLLDFYVPFVLSDSTWELGPLLSALAAAKNPAGLAILADRLANLEYFDYTLRRRILDYAAACGGEDAIRIALHFTDDADSGIKQQALALLAGWLGADAAEARRERYDAERSALVAVANGNAELAAEILGRYVARWPDHPARVDFMRARALVQLERRDEADAALARAEAAGTEEEREAAKRWRRHLPQVRWFYDREALQASLRVTVQPESLQRNRCFGVMVELTNDSDTFWPGGRWTFSPVLRPRVLNAAGEVMTVDDRGREVDPRVVDNPLPLRGVAPGETVTMLLIGHAPYGAWSEAKIGIAFVQAHTEHLSDERDFLHVIEGPWKGE